MISLNDFFFIFEKKPSFFGIFLFCLIINEAKPNRTNERMNIKKKSPFKIKIGICVFMEYKKKSQNLLMKLSKLSV